MATTSGRGADTPMEERRMVAVFADQAAARAAARALQDAGVAAGRVRVGDGRDVTASLRGEMHEELVNTVAGPGNVGPFTKEMTKGTISATLIGTVVGMIIGLPFAAIPMGGLPLWARILIVVAAGGLAGATAGFTIGGALASRGPFDANAAHTGTTVSVLGDDVALRSLLADRKPIRLDIIGLDGIPIDTVTTEEQQGAEQSPGMVREMREHVDRSDDVRRDTGAAAGSGDR